MRRRMGLVVNPTSGKNTAGPKGARAHGIFAGQGLDVVDLSRSDGPATLSAMQDAVSRNDVDEIVVVGGDGVVHHAVNAVAGTGIPLGIVAAGTGNDIARELGLPVGDVDAACTRILEGSPTAVDAVRIVDGNGPPRWFAGVLAGGFDAVVNERANLWRWPRGRARYNLAILRELPVFSPIPYVVEVDGERIETPAMLVAVGNLPAYGGGMKVTPDARPDDGLVDVLVLREISIPQFLRVFPRVFHGGHVDHPAVLVVRGRHVRLTAPGIVAYADGERIAPLPLDLTVVPGALTVLT